MRSSTTETDALLRRLLRAHLVEDPDAPANYSLQLETPAEDGSATNPLHHLFEGPRELVRDRAPARVIGALVTALGGFARPDGAHLQIWATTLVGPAGAVLAPPEWRRRLPTLVRPLRRDGWTVLDTPFASLDLASGAIVVPEPPLTVDAAAAAELTGVASPQVSAKVTPGPYSLRGWLVRPTGTDEQPTRAAALVEAMRLARNRDTVGSRQAFALLAGRLSVVPVARAPRRFEDGEVPALLDELLAA